MLRAISEVIGSARASRGRIGRLMSLRRMNASYEITPSELRYDIIIKLKNWGIFIFSCRGRKYEVVQNADPLVIEFLSEAFNFGWKKRKYFVDLREFFDANVHEKQIRSERDTGKLFQDAE